jgi:hypothetical protein
LLKTFWGWRDQQLPDGTAMMTLRTRTRAQNRAHRIAAERRHNQEARTAQLEERVSFAGPAPPEAADDDPPPS